MRHHRFDVEGLAVELRGLRRRVREEFVEVLDDDLVVGWVADAADEVAGDVFLVVHVVVALVLNGSLDDFAVFEFVHAYCCSESAFFVRDDFGSG